MPESTISPLLTAAAIGVGGFVGSLARWGLGLAIASGMGTRFPWGTLAVNLLGCLAIGLLKAAIDRGGLAQPVLTIALTAGLLGGFTTFSTFALDATVLTRDVGARASALYVLASVGGGIALCVLGLRLGSVCFRGAP